MAELNGWPYVQPTDAVADYPATSLGLAQQLDQRVPVIAYGTASVSVSDSSSGTVEIDLSAWGFTAAPVGVSAISHNFSYFTYYAAASTQTASALTLGVRRYDGSSATVTVTIRWAAVGV